jgi:hypothetical protein
MTANPKTLDFSPRSEFLVATGRDSFPVGAESGVVANQMAGLTY